MKVTEYPTVETLDKSDVLLIDGENGTRNIDAEDLSLQLSEIITDPAWVGHRNIYRGKNLGSKITDAQIAAIQDGSFKDLYVGDYWNDTEQDIIWRIADINYWFRKGDSDEKAEFNHLVIVPDKPIAFDKINETNTTSTGFAMCAFFQNGSSNKFNEAVSKCQKMFGENIHVRREYMSNSDTSMKWTDNYITIMNQIMAFGSYIEPILNIHISGTLNSTQLALFRFNPKMIHNRNYVAYWLQDIVSTTEFAAVGANGLASRVKASELKGIRPVFAVG